MIQKLNMKNRLKLKKKLLQLNKLFKKTKNKIMIMKRKLKKKFKMKNRNKKKKSCQDSQLKKK